MAAAQLGRTGYVLGSRVFPQAREAAQPDRVPERVVSRTMVARADSSCTGTASECQTPNSTDKMAVPIAIGVIVPVTALVITFFFLWRRNRRKLRQEELADPHKSLDFGLTLDPSGGGKSKRKSKLFGGAGEKESTSHRHNQLSMDINLSSPYLLPPGLQSSRESLHSLARTLHQNEDPYRPVKDYVSDAGSIRSYNKDTRDGSSVYTGSTAHDSATKVRPGASPAMGALPRQNSLPKSPSPLTVPSPAHAKTPEVGVYELPSPTKETAPPMQPATAVIETVTSSQDSVAGLQEPAPAAQKINRKGLPASPQQPETQGADERASPPANPNDSSFLYDIRFSSESHGPLPAAPAKDAGPVGLGLSRPQSQTASLHMSPPQVNSIPTIQEVPAGPFSAPLDGNAEYYDDYYQPMPQQPQDQYDYDGRGRAPHRRQSSEYHQDGAPANLGLPQQDNRRLSVGFRPLPPDEMMETEDPETRANRIRSFYKEYFDDTSREPLPQMPAIPQYYEDYDQSYLGDAAYFDPDSNAFVMPYSQPVARRAMTPPPSGSRFPGPRGPPRNFNGSMGPPRGASRPGSGPRPGSSVSNQRGGSRPGSSASGPWGRPRASSNFSGRGPPRRAMPPPAALTTLPTPSKLRDDSFALMGAIDFAPPSTFKDQAAGRSQSPLGERKPYQMKVPVSSPLVSSYDDMAALPSPHLLRKSGTFTGLDFAPPKKFKDNDNISDAGSIRSYRSGISAVSKAAIRSGAGRVSRLPGDQVFTQAAMSQTLKPSWGMRD